MIKNKNTFLLILIIIVGIILRFYDILNLHLVNDELSALNRTNFNSFEELIKGGVMPDGHPALIQVFLYYYTKLFGYGDFSIKLPFLIMGVLSIFLSFKVAKRFFTETSGLFTASFVSILQYTIMYSQLARPYSSGLFFVLLAVYFLQDFILKTNLKKISIIGFIIASILSSYNHYFSLLTVAIIGFFGLFIIKKQNIKSYIISGIIILLLFIPHIKITIYQLSLGGLSWLGEPNYMFISRYFGYIFNYCWVLIVFTTAIFVLGLNYNNGFSKKKFSFFTLLIFILPFVIGYVYSIKVAPVIQFSVLLFSFPFFLMFLSSFIKELNFKMNFIMVLFILTIGVYSLIFVRSNYTTTYNSSFYSVANNLLEDINKYKNDNVSEIFVANGPFYINKYLNEFNIDTTELKSIHFKYKDNKNQIKDFVNNSKTEYMAVGLMKSIADIYLFDIIKEKYPFIVKYTDSYFLFSKNKKLIIKKSSILDTVYYNKLNFNKGKIIWNYNKDLIKIDSTNKSYYHFQEGSEWGLSTDFLLDTILSHKNNIVIINATIKSGNKNSEVILVSEIYNPDTTIHWSSVDLSENSNITTKKTKFQKLVFLQDVEFNKDTKQKIYFWNKGKFEFNVYSIEIIILNGKQNIYGTFAPL